MVNNIAFCNSLCYEREIKMGICLRGKTVILLLIIFLFSAFVHGLFGQDIRVIESNGSMAVISGGKEAGLKLGDTVRIMRLRNDSWKEISRAKITEVLPNIARIEIVQGAPLVNFKPGDFVMKVRLASRSRPAEIPIQRLPDLNFSKYSPYRSQNVYLGPTAGVFIPIGDLRQYIDPSFGCGGMVGIKFRNNFDITTRFFYSYDNPNWYFWSILVLGRRYLDKNFLLDIGYGIGYPVIESKVEAVERSGKFTFDFPLISLGFVCGMGYVLEMSDSMWFELGFLAHYYPNFAGEPGTFITVQGRLNM
jgi:hypothetical protein